MIMIGSGGGTFPSVPGSTEARHNSSRRGAITKYRLLLLHVVLYAVLQWSYSTYITSIWGYQGFVAYFDWGRFIVGLAAVVLAGVSLPVRKTPSSFFLHLCLAITLTPSMVAYAGSSLTLGFALLSVGSFLLVNFASRAALNAPLLPILGPPAALGGLCSALAIFVVSFAIYDGFKFINFDFTQVYKLRVEVEENLPGIYGYLTPIVTKSIIPVAIVIACIFRLRMAAIVIGACSILLFAITTHKSMIFYPLVTAGVFYMGRRNGLTRNMIIALVAIAATSILDMYLYVTGLPSTGGSLMNLFVRRSLFTPAMLNYFYYDFFSSSPPYYWAQSRLTLGLVQSPYPVAPPSLIGSVYFGASEMSANTGWIGSGMANAGIAGVILYSIGLGLLFSLVDSYAKVWGTTAVTAIGVVPIMTAVTSADLVTLLLTHGMLVTLALLAIAAPSGAQVLERSISRHASVAASNGRTA